MKNKRNYLKENGITLIALVVTIVVLLILAGVSLNAIFSENGIIKRAQDAQNKMDQAAENDQKGINELSNWLDSKINGNSGGNTTGGNTTGGGDTPTEKPLITDSSLTSNDRTTSESTTVIAKDKKGNQVVVPGGFKISSASGESGCCACCKEYRPEFLRLCGDGANRPAKSYGRHNRCSPFEWAHLCRKSER